MNMHILKSYLDDVGLVKDGKAFRLKSLNVSQDVSDDGVGWVHDSKGSHVDKVIFKIF